MARPEGLEPPTTWFEARYSIQLSYGRAQPTSIRVLAIQVDRFRAKLQINSLLFTCTQVTWEQTTLSALQIRSLIGNFMKIEVLKPTLMPEEPPLISYLLTLDGSKSVAL